MKYEKSTQKRKLILSRSREVFSQKGFAKVTMADIVSACEISRGGLYRYFQSTSDIFLAVFADEAKNEKAVVETAIWEGISPKQILTDILSVHRSAMLGERMSLALATYEFFIENTEEQVIRRWQFDDLAETLRELIDLGIKKEEFYPVDAAAWGRHLAYFIEGMKLTVPVLQMHSERIDEEIALLIEPLFIDTKEI